MGKGTDKLYITHSEWASEDAFSASAGAGVSKARGGSSASFRRLPYNFCALSLQPFSHPVCTPAGTIFDLTHILPWLKKHGNTNPVDGSPLSSKDLIKLNFTRNDDGEYVDPVTYKAFTDNTHIVALRNTGNVFSWDTVERLNIKAKSWKDLVSDEEFSRSDIITLQDPMNMAARDLNSFKHVKDGETSLTEEQEAERNGSNVNASALGNAAKILKAKEAVSRAREERAKGTNASSNGKALTTTKGTMAPPKSSIQPSKPKPYNAAQHTTGKAAASFTSTGLTPHTSNERALLTDEEYMLKPKRVKQIGYARMTTNLGSLNIELYPEFAPKAVWNFIQLSKRGYYNGVAFHRNIKNFMIQGGDPTGTGRGGQSCWGKPFNDEFEGPLKHDARGIISMANKGKNTNSSQFFILYRPAKHLDLKHTIFAKVVGGLEVLAKLEAAPTDEKDKPTSPVMVEDIVVFVDPFEEFQKQRAENEQAEKHKEEIMRQGGTEDDKMTWTGKRVRADGKVENSGSTVGVGKYLQAAKQDIKQRDDGDEILGDWDEPEPPKKKVKAGGFGNFDAW